MNIVMCRSYAAAYVRWKYDVRGMCFKSQPLLETESCPQENEKLICNQTNNGQNLLTDLALHLFYTFFAAICWGNKVIHYISIYFTRGVSAASCSCMLIRPAVAIMGIELGLSNIAGIPTVHPNMRKWKGIISSTAYLTFCMNIDRTNGWLQCENPSLIIGMCHCCICIVCIWVVLNWVSAGSI